MRTAGFVVLSVVTLLAPPASAQQYIDAVFFIETSDPGWQATGIQVEQGDRIYLFGFAAATWWEPNVFTISGEGQPSPQGGLLPAGSLGGYGIVGKVGNNEPFGVGRLYGKESSPWAGELYFGVNDGSHSDNHGQCLVGILILRGVWERLPGVGESNQSSFAANLHLRGMPSPTCRNLKITYELPRDGMVSLNVYDKLGRLVRELLNEHASAGGYSVTWNGLRPDGTPVEPGTYFYTLDLDGAAVTKQAIIVK